MSNLGQDDPLATTSSTPPIDTDKPRGRTGALTWTTLRKGADGSYSQEFWMFGGKVIWNTDLVYVILSP